MAVQHRGSNWTPDEDRLLRNLVEAGKSWVVISASLKRPAKTIRYRLSVLRRRDTSAVETRAKAEEVVKELRRFSARPWTQADDDNLRALALTGASSRSIGVRMNRTEAAVRSRAGRLKIILRKSAVRRPRSG
jgi:hypothetical protein